MAKNKEERHIEVCGFHFNQEEVDILKKVADFNKLTYCDTIRRLIIREEVKKMIEPLGYRITLEGKIVKEKED